MKDRLAQFLKSEGLAAVKFAEIMEVQPSSISHLLSGRNKPNFEFISRMLLRFPELEPNWIINGIGEIYRSNQQQQASIITDVNNSKVTDVTQPEPTLVKSGMLDFEMDNTSIKAIDGEFKDGNSEITNVNILDFQDSAPTHDPVPARCSVAPNESKSIARVILFYTDGSFEEYHN